MPCGLAWCLIFLPRPMNKQIAIPKSVPWPPAKPNKTREQKPLALLEFSKSIIATLEIEALLPLILAGLRQAVPYDQAALYLWEKGRLARRAAEPSDGADHQENRGPHLAFIRPALSALAVRIRRAQVITGSPDSTFSASNLPPEANRFQQQMREILRAGLPPSQESTPSWVWLPLPGREQALGGILMESLQPGTFTTRHLELAEAIAGLSSAAIENARIYQQARELAALQERQQLARELHDSISQALYGIALGAKTARALLENHPEKALEPLDYIISLASSGLTEMRGLIFELRPEALVEEGLVAAIITQAKAFQSRHQIEVSFTPIDEPQIPYPIKEALYRVVMEAFNNIARHANASQVTIRLESEPAALCLEVIDNGLGFQPGDFFPGHLGLRSMRQRVENIGGTFTIHSAPEQGTAIQINVPVEI